MRPIALHAGNPGPMTGEGNWTWLLPGRVPTLIDAGVGAQAHLDGIERALGGARLAQVIVTHAHSDHASGAPALAARMPAARFMKIPWPDRDGRWDAGWLPLGDGDAVEAGDTLLTVVHTPGHAPDHCCLWHEPTRTLFGGDLAIQGATVWIPAAPHGDLGAYLASLERTIDLEPARMLPAHGPVIEAPIPLLRRYVAHRRERERQVLDALRAGAATVREIAARIYPDLPDALAARAGETILAHLEKLQRERRADCRAEGWHIMGE